MNSIFKFSVFLLALSLTYSCFEDDDDTTIESSEISDFVWKGMNFIYLYKDNIPDLFNRNRQAFFKSRTKCKFTI